MPTVNYAIHVTMPEGDVRTVRAPAGRPLLNALSDHGLPVRICCGKTGGCHACRVVVADAWSGRLAAPTAEEVRALASIGGACGRSRLACQIVANNSTDGLEVAIPRDSLDYYTHWVAG